MIKKDDITTEWNSPHDEMHITVRAKLQLELEQRMPKYYINDGTHIDDVKRNMRRRIWAYAYADVARELYTLKNELMPYVDIRAQTTALERFSKLQAMLADPFIGETTDKQTQ
jgi:hypothetical protein